MIKSYLINCQTSALISHFHNGYEYSEVIEGEHSFLVCQSPSEIVKASFLHVGLDLNGAIKSSRAILKKRNSLPVSLSAQQNIILIRCKLPKQDGSIWLVQSHIYDIEPHQLNQTIVHLIGGHSLIIDIKTDRLQTRRNQATFIRTTLLERSKMEKTMTFLVEKGKGILHVKEEGQINFSQKRKNEDLVEQ